MDSFLEEPRSTPKPTPVIQEISAPTVPEVSLMFQNARKDRSAAPVNMKIGKPMQSYNAWKLRSSPNNNTEYDSFIMPNMRMGNKENINTVQQLLEDKSLLSKKQVRFESPVPKNGDLLQYPSGRQNVLKMKKIPETSVEKIIESNPMTRHDVLTNKSSDKMNTCSQATSVSKPFEKLYVSNIPNRELDLSFLEPAKTPCNFIRTNAGHTVRPVSNSPVSGNRMNPIDYNINSYNRQTRPVLNDALSRNIGYYHTEPSRMSNEPLTRNAAVPYQEILAEVRRETFAVSDRQIRADNDVFASKLDNDSASNQSTSVVEVTAAVPESVQTEQATLNAVAPTPSNENPSMGDLLQIIKLQNEQLQMLQTQVDKLVQLNLKSEENKQRIVQEEHAQNGNEQVVFVKDQQVGTSFVEGGQRKMLVQQESIAKKDNKISVGMMTSFEVSFKPPVVPKKKVKQRNIQPVNDVSSNDVSFYETVRHRGRPRRKQQQQQQEFVPKSSRKQQENFRVFPESWKRPQETEYSLGSQESLEVDEPSASPENSIHIDMQEYDTDTDDEYSMDPGWTFCRDIVGQVNNMYTPAHQETYRGRKHTEVQATDTTLHCIKQATLQHLQNDGFVQANGTDGPLKPNDISFAVQQLLMKYLPDDGLVNVVNKNTQEPHNHHHHQQQHQQQRKPTDVSVATFKYTQQYNVVTNPTPAYHGSKGHKVKTNPPKRPAQRNLAEPKILDITTIKQQPKLL